MTIKELKELLKEQGKKYMDIEVYRYKSNKHIIHTDFIDWVEDYTDDSKVFDYELMDEDEYNETILANSGIQADFCEWYLKDKAKVLIIILEKGDKVYG